MIEILPLRSETLPPATTTNCVLIGQGTFWVVDPGSPFREEQDRLRARVEARVASGETLGGIVLTHRHRDHVAGAHALASTSACAVFAHPITQDELRGKVRVTHTLSDGDHLGDAVVLDRKSVV